jgi:UDP-N-acetylglucosamine 1-carboxyvinyltransferase
VSNYIIEGGYRLEGEIDISGSKNAALPIIAASLLNKGIVQIKNCPQIHDVKIMFNILEKLGCKVDISNSKILIDATNLNNCEIPEDLMHEMRSSVIIVGALIRETWMFKIYISRGMRNWCKTN